MTDIYTTVRDAKFLCYTKVETSIVLGRCTLLLGVVAPLKPTDPFLAHPSQDVDTMPMRGLHEVLISPLAYERLHRLCQGGASPPESGATVANGDQRAAAKAAAPPTFVVVPALEFVGANSPEDPRIQTLLEERDDIKQKAADLVMSGDLQAFHAGCFPEGHRQTNLDLWAALPADAAPYQVKYAEGYEPYGLFSRQLVPPFDERFRGFGLDKVRNME